MHTSVRHTAKRPLVLAMATLLASGAAFADTPSTDLGTLEVTVDRQGAKVKTNVVTLQEKDERTETDLRGLLDEEPAIEFGGGNGTSQYVSIRGMSQNSIDVKVDNAYNDTQILYHQGKFMLDPALVKIVSVQKGAGSASAGIGATNGAIVAKTVDAHDLLKDSDKDWGLKVNGGYGSNADAYNYGVQAFGRTDKFDLLIAANHIDDNNYEAGEGYVNPTDKTRVVPYSALDKRGYLAKAGLSLDKHRFVLSHMLEQHKGVRTVREEFTVFEGNNRQAPTYRETTLSNSSLEWTAKDLGFVSALTANAYLLTNERYSADDTSCGYCGNIAGPTTTTIKTTGGNLNLDSDIGESTVLKYGINYRHQEVAPDRFLKPNLSNPEKADIGAYIEAVSDAGPFTITAGARYDHFDYKAMDGKEVSNGAFSPSVGLVWQATPALSLSANHNYATRSPRLYDALMSHGNRGITSIADNTKAERARNTEVGFNLEHDFANAGKLSVDGGYFWQRIDDAVVNPQNRHGFPGIRDVVNMGHITNQGYEVGATYRLGGLTARVGVAESDPKFHGLTAANEIGPDFAFKVGRTITGSLAYRFDNPNLELGVRHRDVAKSYSTVNQSATNAVQRPAYSVTDIYANWKPFNNDRMNVNFAVNNVGDELYYSHAQRANGGLHAPGRDYRVGINYSF